MRPLRFALLPLLPLLAAVLGGCRQSMAPLCRQICDCSPCTDTDLDACVSKGEAAQAVAEKSGCADTFATLVGCLEDNISCGKNGVGPGTDQCVRADAALVLCDGSVNPFATPCEEASIKQDACTGMPPVTSLQPAAFCTGVTACVARCVVAQPCAVLNGGPAALQPLTTCTNACQMNGPPPPEPGGRAP